MGTTPVHVTAAERCVVADGRAVATASGSCIRVVRGDQRSHMRAGRIGTYGLAALPSASHPWRQLCGLAAEAVSGDNPTSMEIRLYSAADHAEWLRMRGALALHHDPVADALDAAAWLARTDAAVVVAARPGAPAGAEGCLAGFAEVGARPYADGCETSPVAYLEGWYVDPDARRAGVGAALVHAAVAWARAHGFTELASDVLLENLGSQQAHEALGFREVERSVKYRLDLGPDGDAPVA